jgi:transposase-like protein
MPAAPSRRVYEELRKAVYTTNTIEGLHPQIRKAIKTRGALFPDQRSPSHATRMQWR